MIIQNDKRVGSAGTTGFTNILYAAVCAAAFAMETFLAYRQATRYNGKYPSDLSLHLAMIRNSTSNRRMLAPIVRMLDSVTDSAWGIALVMGCAVLLTILADYLLIRYLTRHRTENRIPAQMGSLLAMFTGPVYIPHFLEYYYAKTQSKYAWQNPTQILMTMFAVLALLTFLKFYENYLGRITVGDWVTLTLVFFLSAWAKPSFIMVFFPVVAVYMIRDLPNCAAQPDTAFRIRQIFLLGCTMIPAFIYFLMLNSALFGSAAVEAAKETGTEASHVVIQLGRAYFHQDFNVLLSFAAGMAFPFYVLLFNFRSLRETAYSSVWLMILFGYAEHFTFSETGPRATHGNFAWGKKVAIYLLFVVSIARFIDNLYDPEFLSGKKVKKRVYAGFGILILLLHFVSQMIYLHYILHGGNYMI